MHPITNTKSKTNQKLGPTHQTFKSRILSLSGTHPHLRINKRGLSADSLSLFLSALRPRLFGVGRQLCLSASGAALLCVLSICVNIFASLNAAAASLRLEVPADGVAINDLQPKTGGTFKESDAGEIKVTTDGSFGYTLNIRAKDGNMLKNGTNTLTSISSALTNEQYQAAGNENTWGYKPSKLGSSNNTSFQPGPTTSVVLDKTSTAATEAQTYTVSIGAKVGAGAVSGTYTNTFVFSLTANTASYNVKYNLNDGNGGPSTNPQTGTTTDASITIGAPEPTKDNAEFKGWCSVSTTDENCGGQTYTAGQEYTLHEGENNLELWAMWEETAIDPPKECLALKTPGQTGTFRDPRDGSTYSIARLKDGKCWMTQNLRIINKTIDSTNSDMKAGASFTIPASDISKFTTNYNDDHDAAYYANNTTNGAYYSWHTATAGTGTSNMSSGNAASSICPKGWRLPTGGRDGEFEQLYNQYNSYSLMTNTSGPHFVIAGVVRSGSLINVGTDGFYWSSTTSSGFGASSLLLYSPNSNVSPVSYYGNIDGDSVRCVAREPEPSPELLTQLYTSSTDTVTVQPGEGIDMIMIADGNSQYTPYYATPDTPVTLSSASGRKYVITIVPSPGNVMTNLTKGVDGTITATGSPGSYPSMQDFNSCTAEGTNVTDVRNYTSYTVAKLGSKCYMLSNLRLAAGTALNSSTSNVSSSFTVPTSWSSSTTSPRMKECHGNIGYKDADLSISCDQSGPITEYYYNWPAAKAGTSSATSNGYSICPKNWTLPNYSDDITSANVWNSTSNPGRLATIGYLFSDGTYQNIGMYGNWWASTQFESIPGNAYTLNFYGTGVNSHYAIGSNSGYPVRCMR